MNLQDTEQTQSVPNALCVYESRERCVCLNKEIFYKVWVKVRASAQVDVVLGNAPRKPTNYLPSKAWLKRGISSH